MPRIRQSGQNDLQATLFDLGAVVPQPPTRSSVALPTTSPATPLEYVAVDLEAERVLDAAQDAKLWAANPSHAYALWMASRRVHKREFGEHSVRQYLSMFGGYLRWLAEDTDRSLLTATVVEVADFLESKTGRTTKKTETEKGIEKPASATTRRRYMHLIHGVYAHLVDINLLGHNPVETLVESNKMQDFLRPAPTILSEELMKGFIEWCDKQEVICWVDSRDKAMRLVFLATGLTVHELQSLKQTDLQILNDAAGTVTIEVRAHGFVPTHSVPVAAFARDALLAWSKRLQVLAPDSDCLFPGRDFGFKVDRPVPTSISSPECYTTVQTALNAIGYMRDRQGPQTLRNSFIAHQIWEGREHHRITNWIGLKTNETVIKVSRLVAVRKDGVVPA